MGTMDSTSERGADVRIQGASEETVAESGAPTLLLFQTSSKP